MDSILKKTKCTQTYIQRIQVSGYEQSSHIPETNLDSVCSSMSDTSKCPTLTELIVSKLDANYSLTNDKTLYYKNRLLEIVEYFDSNRSNYGKKMKTNLVQLGFEHSNDSLSSIAVLQDYFSINIQVFHKDALYKLCTKYDKTLSVLWDGHYWSEIDPLKHNETRFLTDLSTIECDIDILDVYPKLLKGISSYKLSDLQEIEKKLNIHTNYIGKKENKTRLISRD